MNLYFGEHEVGTPEIVVTCNYVEPDGADKTTKVSFCVLEWRMLFETYSSMDSATAMSIQKTEKLNQFKRQENQSGRKSSVSVTFSKKYDFCSDPWPFVLKAFAIVRAKYWRGVNLKVPLNCFNRVITNIFKSTMALHISSWFGDFKQPWITKS